MIQEVKDKAKQGIAFLRSGGNQNGFESSAGVLLKDAAQKDKNGLFTLLECEEEGLSDSIVLDKRAKYGFNEVAHEKPPAWYIQFAQSFITPFNGVLFFIASISLVMDVFL